MGDDLFGVGVVTVGVGRWFCFSYFFLSILESRRWSGRSWLRRVGEILSGVG